MTAGPFPTLHHAHLAGVALDSVPGHDRNAVGHIREERSRLYRNGALGCFGLPGRCGRLGGRRAGLFIGGPNLAGRSSSEDVSRNR